MTAHRTRGVALLVVLVLALSGCGLFGSDGSPTSSEPSASPSTSASAPASSPASSPGQPSASTPPGSPVPGGLRAYYDQTLTWSTCRTNAQCARLRVPLDYDRPGGRSIELALLKVPATGSRPLGSMVVNPGGPGASGVDYAAGGSLYFGDRLRAAYDVVGFDPRGVGASNPVDCATDAQFNRLVDSDPDPDTAAERATSDRLFRTVARGCFTRSGGIARHMSTEEVARDLDVLRAALGDATLTYFGASYGTAIGSEYAVLFPQRVGRMVLDGALDPRQSTLQVNLVQARGFETALRAYVGACVDRGACFLGDSVDAGTRRIRAFLDQVEADPLPAGTRTLTVGNAVYGINLPLYSKSSWPVLDQALRRAFGGDGSLLMTLADGYLERDADGSYTGNLFEAFYAVNCLDHDDALPEDRLAAALPPFEKASPTFGAIFAYSATTCGLWPVHTGKGPGAIDPQGIPPVLVVGTSRDPATPLSWAQALSRQLFDSVLVTRDGDGHTGYNKGNTCVDDTVEGYLVEGTVPTADVSC